LLAQRPDWGPFFAVGERVIFLSDGQAYEVTEGDFPPVDVPDAPPVQPDTPDEPPVQPDVPDEPPVQPDTPLSQQPSTDDGDGFPLVPVAAGLGAVAVVLAAGAGVWVVRRRKGSAG